MNEIRFFDRQLHESIFREMQKRATASLEDGIIWYLEHMDDSLWRLLDSKVATLPDQSLEPQSEVPKPGVKRKLYQINVENIDLIYAY